MSLVVEDVAVTVLGLVVGGAIIRGCHRSGSLETDPKTLRFLWKFCGSALGSENGIEQQRPHTIPQGTRAGMPFRDGLSQGEGLGPCTYPLTILRMPTVPGKEHDLG